jgi:hypothetical protein
MNQLYISALNLSQYVVEDSLRYYSLSMPKELEQELFLLLKYERVTNFYSPELQFQVWTANYSFWNGKGFIEINGINDRYRVGIGKQGDFAMVGKHTYPVKLSKYDIWRYS